MLELGQIINSGKYKTGDIFMKNTVIFDLDGLLIDSEIISYRLYCDLLGRYGHSISLEEYAGTLSGKVAAENIKNAAEREIKH